MHDRRIAIDTSKSVFTVHGIDAADQAILRRDLRRAQVPAFSAKLPPTEVVIEACGASQYWGRPLTRLGHSVKLIPPHYVKPVVKRGTSDRADRRTAILRGPPRQTMPVVCWEAVRGTHPGQRPRAAAHRPDT